MKEQERLFSYREKRDVALTVRLPASVVRKIKKWAKDYNYSQSKVIETVVLEIWEKEKLKGKTREN